MPIEVSDLPEAAQSIEDLTLRERDVLALLGQGLTSRDIALRLAIAEAEVYRVIADLLDALEYQPPGVSADQMHERAGSRPATGDEVGRFHDQFGPFDADTEG